jgi:hypothetical protein
MSPDLSGRTFGRMTVIGPASEDVVLPQVAVAGGLAAAWALPLALALRKLSSRVRHPAVIWSVYAPLGWVG